MGHEFVKVQDIAPMLMALIRAVYLAIFGAVSGLLIGLQTGKTGSDLVVPILIGAAMGFLGRGAEGAFDQARSVVAPLSATVAEVKEKQEG